MVNVDSTKHKQKNAKHLRRTMRIWRVREPEREESPYLQLRIITFKKKREKKTIKNKIKQKGGGGRRHQVGHC